MQIFCIALQKYFVLKIFTYVPFPTFNSTSSGLHFLEVVFACTKWHDAMWHSEP